MDLNNLNSLVERLKSIIEKSRLGAIIVPKQATYDTLSAATSLYLSLLEKNLDLVLVSETPVDVDLMGAEKFTTSLSAPGDNLVISFPYREGAVDKVDYQIDGENFNLIITPKDSRTKLDPKQVKFFYTGGNFDFIIVLDTPSLSALGELYQNNQPLFQGREIINIDRHFTNMNFGTLNIVVKNISSLSELIYQILKLGNFLIDKEIATNLYAGLLSATNNFTSFSTTADTFQVASELLRKGALKKIIRQSVKEPISNQIFFNQKTEKIKTPNINEIEKEPTSQEEKTPVDWLKPKIFKGGNLL